MRVCQTDGSQCANPGFETYEAYGDKIWAQAGIDLKFLPFQYLHSTAVWDFQAPADMPGPFNLSALVVYFVPDINNSSSFYGLGWLGGNGAVISGVIFGQNRYDTIAHEIGHNLGLEHYDEVNGGAGCDAGENRYLMSSGSCRTVPNSLGNIYPDGSDYSRLSSGEIATAISTGLTNGWLVEIPEPSSVLLSAAGFLAIGLGLRKR